MIKVHFLQHIQYEGLGSIADWIHENSYVLSVTQLFHDQSLPDPGDIDFLIIMGGPMGIYEKEKYPWLKKEKQFIKKAIRENKKVLGICLGAQLIADVLGAKVYPNKYQEIGWFPVRMTDDSKNSKLFNHFPSELMVFHWHGDTFDIPDNTIHIFENEVCRNQGFQYGDNVLGLQFHLEVRRADIEKWFDEPGDDSINHISNEPYIQQKEVIFANSNLYPDINQYMYKILNSMIKTL